MNIRHDVANYHKLTDEEKNSFWLKELDREYSTIPYPDRIKMEHTSRLVEVYIASSEKDQSQLWKFYDDFSQFYCDQEKYYEKMKRKNALKEVS